MVVMEKAIMHNTIWLMLLLSIIQQFILVKWVKVLKLTPMDLVLIHNLIFTNTPTVSILMR